MTATKKMNDIREIKNPIPVDDVEGEVVEEFVQQLTREGCFIYNTRHDHATVIVENLGYGDVYVSEDPNARAGTDSHRLLFKEQIAYKTRKLFFSSPSEPVVSIIEVE